MHGRGTYAIPRLPEPLPSFAIQHCAPNAGQASNTQHRLIMSSSAQPTTGTMDLEAMQESLARLSHELYGCLGRLEESQLEKELLVAERTQLIGQLQALTTALSWSASSPGAGGTVGRGLEALNAYDLAAAERAEQRVAALRASLPAGSSVRVLCERSELRPHIQDLYQQLQHVRAEGSAESASLHQALARAEGARCRAEGEASEKARQEAVCADAGLRAQVVELEQRLSRQKDEFEGVMRVMKAELYSQQQEALSVAAEAQSEREHEVHQSAAAVERTAVAVAEERGARLAAERRLETARVAHADQVAQLVGLQEEQAAAKAVVQSSLEQHVEGLQKQLRGVLRERQEAEVARRTEVAQLQLSDSQARAALRAALQEKQRLQGTLDEAERQLGAVRQEVDGVKRQQLLLRGKLIDQRQKQQQQPVTLGVRSQPETAAGELPPPRTMMLPADGSAGHVANRVVIEARASSKERQQQQQQQMPGRSDKVVVLKDARGAVVSEMLSVRPATASEDDGADGRRWWPYERHGALGTAMGSPECRGVSLEAENAGSGIKDVLRRLERL